MRHRFLKIATLFLVLAALLLPLQGPARAQEFPAKIDFQVPPDVLDMVDQSDLVELLYLTTAWKSADLLANVRAVDETLTPLIADVGRVLPDAPLPDVAAISRDLEAGLEAIRQSASLAEGRQNADAFLDLARRAAGQLEGLRGQLEPLEADLQARGADIEATAAAQMELQAAELEAELRRELEGVVQARQQEIRSSLEQEAEALGASLAGPGADIAAVLQQVNSFVQAQIPQLEAQLRVEMAERAATAEAQARDTLDQYLLDTFGTDVPTLERIRDGFQDIDQRIQDLAESKMDQIAGPAREAATRKRAEIIGQVVDARSGQAEATIRSYRGAVDRARAQGRQVPDLDALVADLAADKAALVERLSTADTEVGFNEAVSSFRSNWEIRSNELERLHFQGGQEIVDAIPAKLAERDVKAKLLAALETVEKGIEALEQEAAGGGALSAAERWRLLQLRQIRLELVEGLELIEEAGAAQPTDPIDDLLDLVERLQSKLDSVELAVLRAGEVSEIWRYPTAIYMASSPTVAGGVVYVGSGDSHLHAVDAGTGQLIWKFNPGNRMSSSPTVVDGVVYATAWGRALRALDAGTGQMLWKFEMDGSFSTPAVSGGVVYVGGARDHNIYAVDAGTGRLIWEFKTGNWVSSSPAVAGEVVYVGSRDRHLYAFDAGTGQLLWKFQAGARVYSSPAVAGDVVYVGSEDEHLYALDAGTGQLLWKFQTDDAVFSSPTVAGGLVYVGSNDHHLYAIDAGTGRLVWKFKTGGAVQGWPAVAGGVVYTGSFDNHLYALDADAGGLVWSFETGYDVSSSPCVAGGMVYVGSMDGTLHAVSAVPPE